MQDLCIMKSLFKTNSVNGKDECQEDLARNDRMDEELLDQSNMSNELNQSDVSNSRIEQTELHGVKNCIDKITLKYTKSDFGSICEQLSYLTIKLAKSTFATTKIDQLESSLNFESSQINDNSQFRVPKFTPDTKTQTIKNEINTANIKANNNQIKSDNKKNFNTNAKNLSELDFKANLGLNYSEVLCNIFNYLTENVEKNEWGFTPKHVLLVT